jgi:glycosyltransferase involved in cell wall biosynthesis
MGTKASQAPRVSVIIPVHNMEATIGRALNSVLAQTFADYEIICVDDGSTDNTRNVVAAFGQRVTVVTQARAGVSAARNAGACRACGEYFAFLDADDVWREDKLARTVAELDSHRECVLAYSARKYLGNSITRCMSDAAAEEAPSLDDMLNCRGPRPMVPSAVVVRREAFERSGGFRGDLFVWEDAYFGLRLRELGPFRYISEPLVQCQPPDMAKLMGKALRQEAHFRYFWHLVERRYGRRAARMLNVLARGRVNLLSHAGLVALAHGDRRGARRHFWTALWYNPLRMRTYLRLARTFLPRRVAGALSGRGPQRGERGQGDAAMVLDRMAGQGSETGLGPR